MQGLVWAEDHPLGAKAPEGCPFRSSKSKTPAGPQEGPSKQYTTIPSVPCHNITQNPMKSFAGKITRYMSNL